MEAYNLFQNLSGNPLELIFSKIITGGQSSNLADIKFLCRCSLVSKEFNSYISLLSTLSITHWSLGELHDCCPKILKKFKGIRVLYVKHGSPRTLHHFNWKATCRLCPTSLSTTYCMAALSYNSIEKCLSVNHHDLPDSPSEDATRQDTLLCISNQNHVLDMLQLHDRLLMCIARHQALQHVEVTDSKNQGTLILNCDRLNELRYYPYNSMKGRRRKSSCFVGSLHLPLNGFVLKGVTMNIIKKWKDDADAADIKNDDNITMFFNFEDGEMVFSEALVSIFKHHKNMVQIGYHRSLVSKYTFEPCLWTTLPVTGKYSEGPLNFGMGLKENLSPYHAELLCGCVERKLRRRDRFIRDIKSGNSDVQLEGTKQLAKLLAADQRLGDLRSEDVRVLIELLKHGENPELQFYVAFALANIDRNGGEVLKSEAIPFLVDLMISKHLHTRMRGLIALTRIAFDFPESIEDLHKIGALKLLEDVVLSSSIRENYKLLLNCASFLEIICRGKFHLPPCEIRVALRTIKLLVQCGDYHAKSQALSALTYLSHGSYVALEGKACKNVLGLISHADPLVVIPTLQVIGNITTWGNHQQIQFLLRKGLLRRLHSLKHRDYKIVRYEACRIIQSIVVQIERQRGLITLPLGGFRIQRKEGTGLFSIIENEATGEQIDFGELNDFFLEDLPAKVLAKSLEISSMRPLSSVTARKTVHNFSKLNWAAECYTPKMYLY